VGVIGYNVYRNGVQLPNATVPDATPPTTYTDDTASPGTAYTYQVSAVDAAGNESSKAAVSVTTPGGGGGSLTFAPTDDATVDASQPTVNFGTTSRLTVDNSPVNYSLLKFNVTGTAGCSISSAKLRMTIGSTTNDNSPYGGDLYGTSNAWSESNVTWNTAPAAGATKISSVATAVALLIFFRADWARIIRGFLRTLRPSLSARRIVTNDADERLAWLLIIATIPVGLTGVLFEHTFRTLFAKPVAAAIFLMINGLILLAGERLRRAAPSDDDQTTASPTSAAPARAGTAVALSRALIAVLEKKMGLHLIGQDVFVNIAGGVRIDEPAADLGVIAAVASSFLDKPIDPRSLLIGEVGLAGEVRAVSQVENRVREAIKLGFSRCVLPESSRRQLPAFSSIEIIGVSSLAQAWDTLF
jgi:hypothetical protein